MFWRCGGGESVWYLVLLCVVVAFSPVGMFLLIYARPQGVQFNRLGDTHQVHAKDGEVSNVKLRNRLCIAPPHVSTRCVISH